jgi:hypothetical protein
MICWTRLTVPIQPGRSSARAMSLVLKLGTDIIFSSDQKHALAMAYGRVWILDGTNCSIVRSLDPPRLDMFAPVGIQTLNNAIFAFTYQVGLDRFQYIFAFTTAPRPP